MNMCAVSRHITPIFSAFNTDSLLVDDGWNLKSRNKTTNEQVVNSTSYPNGISGLASQIHSLGLKIGIYSDAGSHTCAGFMGSLGYETLDAQTFSSWGVDYLKYDNCNIPTRWADQYSYCVPQGGAGSSFPNGTCPSLANQAPKGYDWSKSNTTKRYIQMRDALLALESSGGRTILYSMCEWGNADVVESWGNATGNSWRMSHDISPSWSRLMEILNINVFKLNYVDFWGHSDADMLEVGNGALTLAESRSHFALWAAMKSPLIIGTALDQLDSAHVAILSNTYLLAFHQDKVHGKPAMPYKWGTAANWSFNASHPAEFWSGASSAGTLVLMMNTLSNNRTMEAKWSEIPQLKGCAYQVTDIWTGKNYGCVKTGISNTLEAHDTAGYIIGKECTTTGC
jgi:alpha-galactosidase